MLDIDSGAESNPAVAGWEAAGLRAPDMDVVRSWRLQQLRIQLETEDVAGIVLFDPLNIRYAVDATNMQVWCTHNAVRLRGHRRPGHPVRPGPVRAPGRALAAD